MSIKLTDKFSITSKDFFSLEFFPPKTSTGFENLQPRLTRLARLQPLFVCVTWGAGGSTAAKSLDLASLCQERYNLTTCLHLTCTNMRQRVLDEALERCKEMGVRNILALRGDEPREEEYAPLDGEEEETEDEEKFTYAVDLVRYIRRKYGEFFCIGVAAYPEGHATSQWSMNQSPQKDLPYLREKVEAGADFILTQLFYNADAFLDWRSMLRNDPSGLFKRIPIVPGLMPVQSWGILARTTKLSCAKVPKDMMARFEAVKSDDDLVKRQGVAELNSIIKRMRHEEDGGGGPRGFHFYTLNLEKAVAQILEETGIVPENVVNETDGEVVDAPEQTSTDEKRRRRLSSKNSGPRNRVIVDKPPDAGLNDAVFEATEDEAGVPEERPQSKANALATAEGQGSLGREATWDDYPNGRFGDARSPAFNTHPTYNPTLPIPRSTALSIWGHPTNTKDITHLFSRYLNGQLTVLPWSEEPLSSETKLILDRLTCMNDRGWWSVASQPAVNAAKSSDEVVGWGPRSGGWVWQRPFVEFFLPSADWTFLKPRLNARWKREKTDGTGGGVIYLAANVTGDFESNDEGSVNPVTWGAFRGKEIITPTIIEAESFRAWRDEAFALWKEWGRCYRKGSESEKFIESVRKDVWLVNCIGLEYQDRGKGFWELLLGDAVES